LSPVQTHYRCQQFRRVAVHPEEVPHPAQVAGREALGCGIGRLQIFRCRDSRAFFSSAADQPTDLAVQLHLRELRRNSGVQRGKHGGVICWLADVHGLSPFWRNAPDQRSKQRKAR
jgi:hypothetical protein